MYTLPSLPYAYDALEPFIDAKTMEIHHTKHHQAYIDKANAALKGTAWENADVLEVLTHLSDIPVEKKTAVRNNAGGHFNHSLFWAVMGPKKGGKPSGDLAKAIDKAFGSFEKFQEGIEAAGVGQFGSGWAWLVVDGGALKIMSTANQDSPVSDGKTPIFGVDVWEHAYYLKYQNKRPDYLKAFWSIVNWEEVARRFAEAS